MLSINMRFLLYRACGHCIGGVDECLDPQGLGALGRIGRNGNGLGHLVLPGSIELHQHLPTFSRGDGCVSWILRNGTATAAGRIGNDQWTFSRICEPEDGFLGGTLLDGSKVVFILVEGHYGNLALGNIPGYGTLDIVCNYFVR